ncbi:uracil-DNA glycosylase-like protein [Mucidula mucida]|nr:uracil-DNA glycosylase-like protein [Mucidula mucida]
MASDDNTVYLEDIEQASEKKITKTAGSSSSTTTTTACKRQRTIMDMFSSSQEKDSSDLQLRNSNRNTACEARSNKAQRDPFSLSAFQDSLSESERALLQLECESMGNSWLKLLKDEIKKPYFVQLKKFLWDEGVRGVSDSLLPPKVYPPAKDIYSWSNTPLGKIKVVIIGQDPYHNPRQAHGLCFSIYQELKAEYPDFVVPNHGNLTAWASNGVLMLNTCLTVRAHEPGSHSNKGWEQFTDKVVDVIDKYGGANLPGVNSETGFGRGVVFLAWGAWAANRVKKLSTTKHLILKSAHPSPKSADRGFFGNGHFKAANEWLEEKYGANGAVDWCSVTN